MPLILTPKQSLTNSRKSSAESASIIQRTMLRTKVGCCYKSLRVESADFFMIAMNQKMSDRVKTIGPMVM